MQLIGLLDSPYVRRVAVSLQCLGLGFEHRPISVFRTFEQFRVINPVVKAPTLICDDGSLLMDSTLILDYAEALAAPRSLMPAGIAERLRALRLIGLALAACEKSIQIVYELDLRPADKRHAPWVERVNGQMLEAYAALEAELRAKPLSADRERIDQAGISVAVAWHFTQAMIGERVPAADYPGLREHSARAEALPAFAAAPHGTGTFGQPSAPPAPSGPR